MARPSKPRIRQDLITVEPYVSPQMAAAFRMNTNESPYAPPERLLEDVVGELARSEFNRYPDRDAKQLLTALSEHLEWPADGIWIGNGSNEVLLHLFLAFGGDGRRSLTFEPTYSLHTLIPKIAGTSTADVPRDPQTWGIDAGSLEEAVVDADVVVFCSPNNPTGRVESRGSIEYALSVAPLVVVDEAYIEFAPAGSSVVDLVRDHPNLVVTRTFSKAWSLAGVRLGFLVGDPELIGEMARVRLPYSLSSFSQLMGVAALRHRELGSEAIAAIITERERILQGLEELGFDAYPSDANFVLFDSGDRQAPDRARTDKLWEALLARGVLVRNYSASEALGGCLRVTAGLPEETDAFLSALKELA